MRFNQKKTARGSKCNEVQCIDENSNGEKSVKGSGFQC